MRKKGSILLSALFVLAECRSIGLETIAQGLEVFYNIELAKSLHITPDFQIIKPSSDRVDTTYIAELRAKKDI